MKPNRTLACISLTVALAAISRAEETGSAHYLPGSMASFIDAFPGTPGGLAVLNYFSYYDGSTSINGQLPMGGFLSSAVNATAYADSIVAVYQTPCEFLGGGYAFGLSVPYVWLEVEGQAQQIGPGGVLGPVRSVRDTASGIGDITLIPFMLGWTDLAPDLKVDFRLGVYAPTGEYKRGQLANIGKNYWTFEPGIMASWISSKIGTEVSLYSGMDFNTQNNDSDYTSGTSLHFDLTVAQHLPLFGGIFGLGANAFYYQQITGDSGSGARLGDFKGMTAGIGPVLSYVGHIGDNKLLAELKWLPEMDVDKRMKGDYVWFKLGVTF
ncbi:MAG: transporter [Akkermansiaceae bacterium]|nr:transporter [Akkermansiaceae bacterium]MCF7731080.1 transporter [Akkermansiaceae bacterium]